MSLHEVFFSLLVLLLPTQLGRHFWPKWSYVYGLRIDYLAPTVYLTDLVILGILISWGVEKLKIKNVPQSGIPLRRKKIKITKKNSKNLILLVLIFTFLFFNCLTAQNHGAAFYKFFKIIEFTFLGFYISKEIPQLLITNYQLLSVTVIYSSLIAITQFFKQSSLGGIFWWLGERTFNLTTPGIAKGIWREKVFLRPYGTFSHPNSLAGFILICLILILGNESLKKTGLLAIFLGLVVLVTSFSRSVWIVGLSVGFIYFLFRFWKKLFTYRSFYLFIFSIFYLLFFIFYLNSTLFDESVFRRLELNLVAIKLIKQSSFFGVGLNNFIPAMVGLEQNFGWTYWLQPVHNIYLLIAAETGLIGLVIFLWLIFLLCKRLLITNYQLLITALIAILFLGFFDHYWLTLQQNQILMTIIFGLCCNKKIFFHRSI